ncbi:OmpA family protein [Alphaproteobacteria bacterium]|jgi:chemotaxis protein MotB|nr:OmpA family protein [Alphaproteobacteria bacterium]MDB2637558.1 OmpA family protein [Alphaproteobacteria bacterium]MDC1036674.1 OmpA family protein [Alphaproteobacteria bacterium]
MAEDTENEVIEEEEEECPKCPPVGAPAWMATFADMATLLMAFFVLILSFAEFNVPKFKQISGSLKNAFGVQKIVPIVEQPKGTTVLSLNFSPSPAKSVTDEMTQQTTETTKPELESQTKTKDSDGSGEKQSDAEDLVKALEEAVARGDIQVETLGENVVVNFTPTEADQKDLPQLLQQTLNAIEKAKAATGKSDQDVLFGGIEGQLKELAAAANAAAKSTQEQAEAKAESNKKAQIAEDELKVALRQEIGQGLADVQREDDKVIITVGAGGAFASGSANLTPEAIEIMNRIAEVNAAGKSKIKVSGHTDDVPLIFGSNYRDNWDLAAARSASVVQAFAANGTISEERLEAISYGESRPVEPNDTSDGRAKNRRIEIEINY